MTTNEIRSLKFRMSVHLVHRLEERGIPPKLVLECIKKGRPCPSKDSALGRTWGFRLGAFKVFVGFFGTCPNVLTAFWDDQMTGLRNGVTPPYHRLEEMLSLDM